MVSTYFLVASTAAILSLLARRHPTVATTILVGILPTYLIRFTIVSLPTNLLEVSTLAVLLGALSAPKIRSRWQQKLRSIPLLLAAGSALILASAIIGTIVSAQTQVSLGILKSWFIIPMLIGLLIVLSKPLRRNIIWALVIAGTTTALIALTQFQVGSRLTGIYDVPNSLALYLVPLTVLALWLIPRHPIYLLAAGAMYLALLGTHSVAGIVVPIIVMILGLSLWRTRPTRLYVSIILIGLILSTLAISLSGKLDYLTQPIRDGSAHSSLTVRRQLWSVSWDLIRAHPLVGLGLGQFEPHYQQQLHQRFNIAESGPRGAASPLREFVFRDPHNWIAAWWLNTGLLGLIGFITLSGTALWSRRASNNIYIQSLVLTLLAILIHGLVDTIYWKNDLAAFYWIVIALLTKWPAADS